MVLPSSPAPAAARPRGFIFDLDGTLVANMPLHAEAFALFGARHGLRPFTEDLRARLAGKRNRDIFPILFRRELDAEEQRRYAQEKEGLYRDLARGRLAPLPGLVRLLDLIDGRGLPCALATSAPIENVAYTLAELGLGGRI